METLDLLRTWAPFMLLGFGKNIGIASLAMLIGTALGSGCALLRGSKSRALASGVEALTSFVRNVPTLVLLFYLATLLPNALTLPGGLGHVELSPWFKAALALAGSPLGFTSWNLHAARVAWEQHQYRTAMLFIPNWLSAFLITVLASSTASLVGVDELVSRCNTIIKASGTNSMFPVYLYASCHFLLFCLAANLVLGKVKQMMLDRYPLRPDPAACHPS